MENHELERLKLLFDYTKFHIGLYATLITLIIALLSLASKEIQLVQRCLLVGTTLFFILAGACGGVVASNIPIYSKMKDFWDAEMGPRKIFSYGDRNPTNSTIDIDREIWMKARGRDWATREHAFFWFGMMLAFVTLVWGVVFPEGLSAQKNPFCPISLECRDKW